MQYIENRIIEGQFDSEWERLRTHLLFTGSWLTGKIKEFLQPFGITQKQFDILRILDEQSPDPIRILDIRAKMVDPMSDVSRLIDRLDYKGLVRREVSLEDKRQSNVFISEEGSRMLKQVLAKLDQLDSITKGLSEEEARQMNDLLLKLRQNTPVKENA